MSSILALMAPSLELRAEAWAPPLHNAHPRFTPTSNDHLSSIEASLGAVCKFGPERWKKIQYFQLLENSIHLMHDQFIMRHFSNHLARALLEICPSALCHDVLIENDFYWHTTSLETKCTTLSSCKIHEIMPVSIDLNTPKMCKKQFDVKIKPWNANLSLQSNHYTLVVVVGTKS